MYIIPYHIPYHILSYHIIYRISHIIYLIVCISYLIIHHIISYTVYHISYILSYIYIIPYHIPYHISHIIYHIIIRSFPLPFLFEKHLSLSLFELQLWFWLVRNLQLLCLSSLKRHFSFCFPVWSWSCWVYPSVMNSFSSQVSFLVSHRPHLLADAE
jgi:hypothetical protein